mgnify:CR=1 FL=1
MSIIKAVQDWLSEYEGMSMRPLSEIRTDLTEEQPSSYALAAAGNTSTKAVTGTRHYTNSYIFYAKESAQNEVDRQDNNDFLERLTEWIETQADKGYLPELPGQYVAEGIEVSNGMLLDLYEDGTGLYQVQIQFTFYKRS